MAVGGDLGGAAVASTAGFLQAMRNLSPSLGQGAQAALAYTGQNFNDPLAVPTAGGGMGDAAPSNPNNAATAPMMSPTQAAPDPKVLAYLQALNAAAQQKGAAGAGAAGASTASPSVNDYITAILGQGTPTAPSAADFGPAPQLSDFFSSTPYDQALASVASGSKAAQGSIGSDYTAANSTLGQIAALVGQNSTSMANQMNQDSQRAVGNMNGYAQQAQALAGPGGGVASRLAALQGTLGGQQAAQQSLGAALQGIQNFNTQQDRAGVATNKQSALDSLAAQVAGANNRIGLAESQDQTKAQQELASANSARGTAMAKAGTDYQNALKSYDAQRLAVLNNAMTQAKAATESNRNAAQDTWAGWAGSGNQNGDFLNQTMTGIINGGKSATGTSLPAAKNQAEAITRLNNLADANGSPAPRGSIAYNILLGNIGQYYKGGNTAPDIMGALSQMAGAY